MNNIIIKSSLIGFIVGILMSFNMMFVGIGGNFIYLISLWFLVDTLAISEDISWIIGWIFFILVYTLYGSIIGYLIKKIKSN